MEIEPWENHKFFSRHGWEFYMEEVPSSELLRARCGPGRFREAFGCRVPQGVADSGLSIRHKETGIKFHFNAHDALCHWVGQKFNDRRFGIRSFLPTYASPLKPTVFDSPYTGRFLIEREGVQTHDFYPLWHDVHWGTVSQQAVWTDQNQLISGPPIQTSFTLAAFKPKSLIGRRLEDPLFNYGARLLESTSISASIDGFVYHIFHLVVTRFGWFFSLRQVVSNRHKAIERVREMTMHCNFNDDIVYREIIERQSRDFEGRLFTRGKDEADTKMLVHYHEVKKLDIRGRYIRGNSAGMVRNVSVTPAEMNEISVGELELNDDKIGLLSANFGSEIEVIEAITGTRIQIIPFFHFPHNPVVCSEPPRIAHIYGLKNSVEDAKFQLTKLLSRKGVTGMKPDTPSTTYPPSSAVFY